MDLKYLYKSICIFYLVFLLTFVQEMNALHNVLILFMFMSIIIVMIFDDRFRDYIILFLLICLSLNIFNILMKEFYEY